MKQFLKLLCVGILSVTSATSWAQKTQVPPVVQNQLMAINDQFNAVLNEECRDGMCYPVGCEVSRFLTLDEQQTSSLPGLETANDPNMMLQYKLASARCEFTYEPSMTEQALTNLRQRLAKRITPIGVSVQMVARKLNPKAPGEDAVNAAPVAQPKTFSEAMIPFAPWLISACVGVILLLLLIFSIKRLFRPKEIKVEGEANPGTALAVAPTPTSYMLLGRINQLREELKSDSLLVEQSLKFYLDNHDYTELMRFLRNFGPSFLEPFKSKAEYIETLNNLGKKFREAESEDTPADVWGFLDRLERAITAAKVQIEQTTVEEEFGFLATLEVGEFIELLKEVSEPEAVTAIAYAPRSLRERCFSEVSASFTANFIGQLTEIDKLPDSFAREAARKLRKIYMSKGGTLKRMTFDRLPLLEEALNALEPSKRKSIIADLEKGNPKFYGDLAPQLFFDESLVLVPEALLNEVFLNINPQEAAHYLLSFEKGEKVLGRLNQRIRDGLKSYIHFGAKANHELANGARNKVSQMIKEKDASGAISLRAINEKLISQ
jgi:hypothetical protein